MKRTLGIVFALALALAGNLGCGAKSPQPDNGSTNPGQGDPSETDPGKPDPGHKTCRNPEANTETCGTSPDPTTVPDAGVTPP